MERTDCTDIVLSAMALMDGETGAVDRAAIEGHMRTCARCASDVEALGWLAERLATVTRATVDADVWPAIDAHLDRAAIPAGLALTAGSLCLLAWRTLETAAVDPLALWTRPVTVALAVSVFLVLRVNPFRVEPRLV